MCNQVYTQIARWAMLSRHQKKYGKRALQKYVRNEKKKGHFKSKPEAQKKMSERFQDQFKRFQQVNNPMVPKRISAIDQVKSFQSIDKPVVPKEMSDHSLNQDRSPQQVSQPAVPKTTSDQFQDQFKNFQPKRTVGQFQDQFTSFLQDSKKSEELQKKGETGMHFACKKCDLVFEQK